MAVAAPIAQAHFEEGEKHPKGGSAFAVDLEKRVAELKRESSLEKKKCSPAYKRNMIWAGVQDKEELNKKCEDALESYRSGEFFLERIGRYREVDLPLALTVFNLRMEWIKESDIKTIPEFMILDLAFVSYFNFMRMNGDVNNITANIEWDLFAAEAPKFKPIGVTGKKPYGQDGDKAVAEELAHHLVEILQPTIEQYHKMFLRSLKALRDLRRASVLLNIDNVGQVNIGEKQVNIEKV